MIKLNIPFCLCIFDCDCIYDFMHLCMIAMFIFVYLSMDYCVLLIVLLGLLHWFYCVSMPLLLDYILYFVLCCIVGCDWIVCGIQSNNINLFFETVYTCCANRLFPNFGIHRFTRIGGSFNEQCQIDIFKIDIFLN